MEKNILIIEDDVSILRGLKDNLAFEGYRVTTAADGIQGLKLALESKIDLLLLDLMLPGENGYEICRKVKKEKPDLPVIMITARGSEIHFEMTSRWITEYIYDNYSNHSYP